MSATIQQGLAELAAERVALEGGPRDSGRTSQQMRDAPQQAVFVWCNGELSYPHRLARHINRTDLRIVGPAWAEAGRMEGCAHPIVFDHAACLGLEVRDRIKIINDWLAWKAEAK